MHRSPLIASLILPGLLIAACGSSSPGSSTGTTARVTAGSGIAFAACMRANGVPNFPDPTASAGGGIQIQASQRNGSGATMTVNGVPVSAPAFRAAMTKCNSKLPSHAGQIPIASLRSNALAMAKCMRAHGVPNFPDPQVSASGGGVAVRISAGSGVDPSSPAFQKAQTICMPLMRRAAKGA